MSSRYGLDNAWELARQRLEGLEAMGDPGTIRHLEGLGVGEGWTCLEAGAGAGSIVRWLCERVGDDGSVLAVDINTRFVDDLDEPNLHVAQLDVSADHLPAETFDLVHTRAVIGHVSDPQGALDNLVNALAPDGWLLVEELDFVAAAPVPGVDDEQAAAFNRVNAAHLHVLERGFDPYFGRRLVGEVEARGLEDVGAEGRTVVLRGGTSAATAWRLTFEQLSGQMVDSGLVTEREIDEVARALQDPAFAIQSMVFMAAWGRRAA